MSNSIADIVSRSVFLLIALIVLPMISNFFKIGLSQAFATAFVWALMDLIVYEIKKVKRNKK